MSKTINLFEKDYDGESLYDLGRDISECIMEDYNPAVKQIPQDEHGFQLGTFRVVVQWIPD
jgi:hypothetical protein